MDERATRDPRDEGADVIDLRGQGAPAMAWATPESEVARWHELQSEPGLPTWAAEASPSLPEPDDDVDTQVAKVNAWAERLRAKKEATKARYDAQSAADRAREADATYWTTEALFAESRAVEEDWDQAGRSAAQKAQLLAVLGLDDTASTSDAQARFKQLVKQHHPDRWVHAEPVLRERHAEQMQRINAAWRALKPYLQ